MRKREAPESISNKKFWTPKDAARYLGVSATVIYAWLNPKQKNERKASKLLGPRPPVYRFGQSNIRFPIDEFIKWVEQYRQE